MLLKQARKYPRKLAVIGERRVLTYQDLLRETEKTARIFRSWSLGPGDHLLLGLPPCPEFFVMFYAAAALGVAVIPVSPSGNLAEKILSLERVAAAGEKSLLAKLRRSGLKIDHEISWSPEAGLSLPRDPQTKPARFTRSRIARHEPILGSFTSGSTGEPALIFRTVEVLFKRAKLGAAAWGVRPTDILLSTGPFTSGVNAVYNLVAPVLVGCSVAVLEKFERRRAVEAIASQRVTRIFAVPLIFDVLARLPRSYRPDFSSLKNLSSVGAHLPRSIYDAFYKKFGLRIGQGYGGTDFALAFTVNRQGLPDAVGHRDGIFPVRILEERGKPARARAIGEIAFDILKMKDRSVRTALLANSKRHGRYLFTGDLGRFDRGGNLYVVGRKSAMIKVGANRVIPAEVENVLRSHPRVREALVMPIRPGRTDEAVGAIVVRNGRLTEAELLRHCAERLDLYKCPREIVFRKNLARGRHGKIRRYLYDTRARRGDS
jgi:long-chain acyl-CoA synthetase